MKLFYYVCFFCAICFNFFVGISFSQDNKPTIAINVTEGVIDPVLVAVPSFVREGSKSNATAG